MQGFFIWYDVEAEATASYLDLNKKIKSSGVVLAPFSKPNLAHVFRRICTEFTDQGFDGWKITKNSNNKNEVSQDISWYGEIIGTLIFNKKDEAVSLELVEDTDYEEEARGILVDVNARLEDWAKAIHHQPLRESIRLTINFWLDGLPMKPTGEIYFVTADRADRVKALQEYADSIDGVTLTVCTANDDVLPAVGKALYRSYESTHIPNILDAIAKLHDKDLVMAKDILAVEALINQGLARTDHYSTMSAEVKAWTDQVVEMLDDCSERLKEV